METYFLLMISSLVFLGIGWNASKYVTDFHGYILARKTYGVFALTATVVASFVGGGFFIGTIEKAGTYGVAPAFALLGFTLQLLLTGLLFCKNIDRFQDCYTVGDIIRKAFGKRAQFFVGVLWISFSVGIITAQMAAMGKIISVFTHFDYSSSLILAGVVVITYCTLGGVRAVVATDVIQFIIVVTVLPLCFMKTLYLFSANPMPIAHSLTSLPGDWGWPALTFAFLGFVFGDALIAPVIQRILMAKSSKQAKLSFSIAALITIPLSFIAASIGIYMVTLHPNIEPNLSLHYFLNHYFTGWEQAIVITALIALIVSSADTYLNSTASVLVNDVILPLKRNMSDSLLLDISRIFTFCIGLLSIFFAISVQSIFDLLLYTYKFWGPIILIPITCAFYNYRLTERQFFSICFAGGVTVVVWNVLGIEDLVGINDLFAGLLVSFTAFVYIWRSRRELILKRLVDA